MSEILKPEDPGAWIDADGSGLDEEWRAEIYLQEAQSETPHEEGDIDDNSN